MSSISENDSMLGIRDVVMEQRTKPDEVLDRIGSSSCRLLLSVLLCSSSWMLGGISLMTSVFTTADCHNCTDGRSTVVTEFDLRGDRSQLAAWSTSFFMLGNMIGGSTLTHASDRFGRRPVLLCCLAVQAVGACVAALSPDIYTFSMGRMIQGVGYTGANLVAWVCAYESSPRAVRSWTTLLFGLSWLVGYCLVAPLSFFSLSWRTLVIVGAIPIPVFLAACYLFVPETLHYLVSQRNLQEIEHWLNTVGENVPVKVESLIAPDDNVEIEEETSILREIIHNKKLVLYFVVQLYLWICDNFVYFGLSLYSNQLAGNVYVNYLLMGIVELPAYLIAPLALERFGGKLVVAVSDTVAGLCFFGTVLFEADSLFSLWLWLVGKFAISCSFMSLFVYGSEIFPTPIRNASIGLCAVLSRIGGMLAPHIGLLTVISPNTPVLLLGVISSFAGLLTLLLPETRGKPLPSRI